MRGASCAALLLVSGSHFGHWLSSERAAASVPSACAALWCGPRCLHPWVGQALVHACINLKAPDGLLPLARFCGLSRAGRCMHSRLAFGIQPGRSMPACLCGLSLSGLLCRAMAAGRTPLVLRIRLSAVMVFPSPCAVMVLPVNAEMVQSLPCVNLAYHSASNAAQCKMYTSACIPESWAGISAEPCADERAQAYMEAVTHDPSSHVSETYWLIAEQAASHVRKLWRLFSCNISCITPACSGQSQAHTIATGLLHNCPHMHHEDERPRCSSG